MNLDWWPVCIPYTLKRHRTLKTNVAPEWRSRQGRRTAEKTKSKRDRDLNGFGDPSFPFLVNEKIFHWDFLGLNADWWPYFLQDIQLLSGAIQSLGANCVPCKGVSRAGI